MERDWGSIKVTIFPDRVERYFSHKVFLDIGEREPDDAGAAGQAKVILRTGRVPASLRP